MHELHLRFGRETPLDNRRFRCKITSTETSVQVPGFAGPPPGPTGTATAGDRAGLVIVSLHGERGGQGTKLVTSSRGLRTQQRRCSRPAPWHLPGTPSAICNERDGGEKVSRYPTRTATEERLCRYCWAVKFAMFTN